VAISSKQTREEALRKRKKLLNGDLGKLIEKVGFEPKIRGGEEDAAQERETKL